MKITYIHHSCFLVETACSYYLFDYEQGTLPPLDTAKPVFVLASHRHHDHYQPAVFRLLRQAGMQDIRPVLSSDILPDPAICPCPPIMVTPGSEYCLGTGQTLFTLKSTDEGVAFLLSDHDELIYHAGDLNDWFWEEEDETRNTRMTADYRAQIDTLARLLDGRQPDAAFVVLDPRQEAAYARGMLYFLEHISARMVFPMHYWDQPQIIRQFLEEYPKYRDCIADTENYMEVSYAI